MHRKLILFALAVVPAAAQAPFTLQQVMSAPFATSLTAAPTGPLFAWVEDAEGRHNLWIGGANAPARMLTHNTEDDAQDTAQLAWSPDAGAIAYTYGANTGADGKPANPAHLQRPTPVQVIVQPIAADAKPIVLGDGHAPLFTRDGASLLFVRGGQIWIAELSQRKQCLLPEGCPAAPADSATPTHQLVFDRGSASQLTLSPDGNTLAFISRRSEANQPAHSFLALYNLTTHTLSFPAPSTGDDSAPAFSPDGKQLAWLRSPFTDTTEFANPRNSPNPWSIQLLDLTSQEVSSRPAERPASSSRTVFSSTPNQPGSVLPHLATDNPFLMWTADHRILFFSEADGWVHLYALDPGSTKPPVLLTPGSYEVEDATLDTAGHMLFWASNDGSHDALDTDRRHLWQLNVTHPGEAPKLRTPGVGIETHPAVGADGSTLAALVSLNARTPMQAALIAPGKITPLHADAAPKYPAAALVMPQQVVVDSTDHLRIHGQLFLPAHVEANTKHPALIFVHGGPHRQMLLGYPAMGYYSNAYAMNQYLASRGFIVLSVNYRCGIGYGMDFRQCEREGPSGAAEYNDVLAAAKYLRSRADVDTKRIGIWGGSYGGLLTAQALGRNSDLFAAGVDFHGVHDWNLEDNAGDWRRGSNAEQDALGALALKSSPMADVATWRSPVLLIHGDNDPEVAYAQTPLLAEALRARHVPVEELIFPDELHVFVLHKDWLAAYEATAAFFERALKP